MITTASLLMLSCTSAVHDREESGLPGFGPIIHEFSVEAQHSFYGMVATGTEESTRIAVEVLEAGGNAVDAAVAAAFALGVADPGDSGLGGATYIVIRLADGRAVAVDGSALMPLRADHELLAQLDADGAEAGMVMAAVPGSLAALEHVAARYGTFPLADLIEPSIELALRGYRANAFQEVSVRSYFDDVMASDFLKFFMLDLGTTPPDTETVQCRPILANTLRRIARRGAAEFYRGSIAAEIESDVVARGGFVSRGDLGILRVGESAPLRGSYRGVEVLAMPYPSMGGAVLEALNILERFPPEKIDQDTVERYHLFTEAFHMAAADHARYWTVSSGLADQARGQLVEKGFAARRASLIVPGQAVVNDEFPADVGDPSYGGENTTQVSIVDRWGNAVSLTQTLGRFFGNKRLTPSLGFPYNNMLEGSQEIATRGPIPTFMSPVVVVKEGEVLLVLGSGASDRIPGILAGVISNFVDRGFDLADSVLAPRIVWNLSDEPELHVEVMPPISSEQVDELESFGYQKAFRAVPPVRQNRFSRFGSVNSVHLDRHSRMLTGVGDPRRNGVARGAEF